MRAASRDQPASPASPSTPRLSVIVVTLNEAENIEDAVLSLKQQEAVDLEVLIIDGKSTDDTVPRAKRLADDDPRVRVFPSAVPLAVGPSRNLGLHHARAPFVAFMSADASAAPGWARAALDGLEHADIVYGRQEHTPHRDTVATITRGLRYHHFQDDARRPASDYASNVNAAVRRAVFERLHYVDDGPASALDDILFTREAEALGYRIGYRRDMLVRHKDTATLRDELRKNRREGLGWGLLSPQLGLNLPVVAWAVAIALSLAALIALPHVATVTLFALMVWSPALRRGLRSLSVARRAPLAWLGAILVSPIFDLAFLFAYLTGLRRRRGDLTGRNHPQGA